MTDIDVVVTASPEHLVSRRSIQEFWIDFLLEEEFSSNPDFVAQFQAVCRPDLPTLNVSKVMHSHNDQWGEADILVLLSGSSSTEERPDLALLIEDKLSAGFQPKQAERYKERGEAGIPAFWKTYVTVLVAPARYLIAHPNHGFDRAIALETLKDWLCNSDPVRRKFKRSRIDRMTAFAAQTGVRIIDPVMTEFRRQYFEHLAKFNADENTNFEMRAPDLTYDGDTWVMLRSKDFPHGCVFRHMMPNGNIELQIRNAKPAAFDQLIPEMNLIEARRITMGVRNQNTAFRCNVDEISSFADYNNSSAIIEAALKKAAALLRIYRKNRFEIDKMIDAARVP